MDVIHEIFDSVVCWEVHGCGCVVDDSPHGKSNIQLNSCRV
jgi:hypothetical protein